MKHYAPLRPPVRIPAFHPVPLRGRRDGWTPLRQAEFIGQLAVTRSVSAAARRVGMARESAYRLRGRAGAGSFAAAWDAALGLPAAAPKITLPDLYQRIANGTLQPVVQRGRLLGVVQKHDNAAILSLLARLARAAARTRQAAESHSTKMAT